MKAARVSSSPRPANGGPAYLWWICIRMVLIFALALLPVVAGGFLYLRGLREKADAREAERSEVSPQEVEDAVAER